MATGTRSHPVTPGQVRGDDTAMPALAPYFLGATQLKLAASASFPLPL